MILLRESHTVLRSSLGRKTILLAEGRAPLRRVLRATLGEKEFRILEAAEESQVRTMAAQERPDLLLLGPGMPGLSAADIHAVLEPSPPWAPIPFVLLRGTAHATDALMALCAAADACFTTPFSPRQLLEKIHQLLGADGASEDRRQASWAELLKTEGQPTREYLASNLHGQAQGAHSRYI